MAEPAASSGRAGAVKCDSNDAPSHRGSDCGLLFVATSSPPWLVGPDQSSLSLAIAYPDALSIEETANFSADCTTEAWVAATASALGAGGDAGSSTANRQAAKARAAARTKNRVVMMRLPRLTVACTVGAGVHRRPENDLNCSEISPRRGVSPSTARCHTAPYHRSHE